MSLHLIQGSLLLSTAEQWCITDRSHSFCLYKLAGFHWLLKQAALPPTNNPQNQEKLAKLSIDHWGQVKFCEWPDIRHSVRVMKLHRFPPESDLKYTNIQVTVRS